MTREQAIAYLYYAVVNQAGTGATSQAVFDHDVAEGVEAMMVVGVTPSELRANTSVDLAAVRRELS